MRGVHAVVFMVDPTKKWTFDYVLRELPKIPSGLSTLLLVPLPQAYPILVSRGHFLMSPPCIFLLMITSAGEL